MQSEGPIRVAFANRAGAESGGAEESLALLMRYLPSHIIPHAILFGDGQYAERLRGLGIPVHIIPIADRFLSSTREKPDISAALHLPASIARVRAVLRQEKIDIVHTNTVKAHLIVVPAAKSMGVASVVHLRDMVPGIGKTLINVVARSATRRVAISQAVNAWYGLPATDVIYNPVELPASREPRSRAEARAALGIPADLPLVSIVGRINRWKGHDRFLQMAKRVLQSQDCRFAIVGEARFRDSDFVPELHAMVEALGLSARVHFIPWQNDLRDVYIATNLLCNCSEREPFGRTMVEAASEGVASVAFDDGGAPDIIVNDVSGYLVPAGDVELLARAVSNALEPATAARLAREARSRSSMFEASSHAARMADMFREIHNLRLTANIT